MSAEGFGVDAWEGVTAYLLGVVAAEEGTAGGPATGGVVELSEAEAAGSEGVEVWGLDFTAIATEVGPAEVVGDDDENVGGLSGSELGTQTGESEDDGKMVHVGKRKTPGWFK